MATEETRDNPRGVLTGLQRIFDARFSVTTYAAYHVLHGGLDPSGMDGVTITDKGNAYWVGPTGSTVKVGTVSGDTVSLSNTYGGGTIDVDDLHDAAAGSKRGVYGRDPQRDTEVIIKAINADDNRDCGTYNVDVDIYVPHGKSDYGYWVAASLQKDMHKFGVRVKIQVIELKQSDERLDKVGRSKSKKLAKDFRASRPTDIVMLMPHESDTSYSTYSADPWKDIIVIGIDNIARSGGRSYPEDYSAVCASSAVLSTQIGYSPFLANSSDGKNKKYIQGTGRTSTERPGKQGDHINQDVADWVKKQGGIPDPDHVSNK